ncbi:hypothetical protein PPL_10755 [Heterostelium album PN500]|uniref:IPT/TIG domain-containing protein n=1 Tax=Heterostelium pallidum (strain ATCC 26659 / Pp 5 / PN500) TaxID=670386 RepID=D3BSC9_HETP5|nr:hypothetical protein PPL_10755 [Heterostelium album PN500]EFA75702.1 hypothetical protein PPL_10755 [Heterostelium album PN500]|eukprot:XP_020427836.1 hypothetical protein PPL_10755 [Heterostelium album PN500]
MAIAKIVLVGWSLLETHVKSNLYVVNHHHESVLEFKDILYYSMYDFDVVSINYDNTSANVMLDTAGVSATITYVKLVDSVRGGAYQSKSLTKPADKNIVFPVTMDLIFTGTISFCNAKDVCAGTAKWNPHVVDAINIYSNATVVVFGKYLNNTAKNEITINSNIKMKSVVSDSDTNTFQDNTGALLALVGSGPFNADFNVRLDVFNYKNAVKIADIIKGSSDESKIYITTFGISTDPSKVSVTIDTKSVTFVIVNDSMITVDIQANSVTLGKKTVVVTTPTVTKTLVFTVALPMTITSCTPPSIGGGPVQIIGTNFPDTPSILIGVYPCKIDTSNRTSINCKLDKLTNDSLPLANVKVTITFEATNTISTFAVSFTDIPTITDISMAPVVGGNVTIKGTNFKTPIITGFNSQQCTYLSSNATQIICKAASGSGSKQVVSLQSAGFNCTMITRSFSYMPPHVTATSNMTDAGGVLKVNGTNFAMKGLEIILNGNYTCPKPVYVNDTIVTCTVDGGYLKKLNQYNNTLFVTVVSDGQNGTAKVFSYTQFVNQTVEPSPTPQPSLGVSFAEHSKHQNTSNIILFISFKIIII